MHDYFWHTSAELTARWKAAMLTLPPSLLRALAIRLQELEAVTSQQSGTQGRSSRNRRRSRISRTPPRPLGSMARQSPKPLAGRVSGWGATGSPNGSRPLLTSAQYAETRRKRADVDAKLKQLTAAERERRR